MQRNESPSEDKVDDVSELSKEVEDQQEIIKKIKREKINQNEEEMEENEKLLEEIEKEVGKLRK